MQRVIVGTAGHIDHGKTRLIEALTGIDCDRWQEEKDRGITIDLGFAHLREGDLQLGFVDVPGHEKFLHNALAGLGGIRIVLLVVAADEGVEPQTQEHLAICSLLDIPHALVALTKTDLVEDDLAELAQLEVEELLETTPFAGAPVLPVSAVSGAGIDVLRQRLVEMACADPVPHESHRPARLPIDRAFHLKGLGVLVTGTLLSGSVATGDELEVMPRRQRVRVRGIQVHGESRELALPGERTSLRLSGVELGELARGSQLVSPGRVEITHRLLARYTHLEDADVTISGWTPARVHLYSAATLGKVRPVDKDVLEPGDEGIVEIRLDSATTAVRGDHVILRRPSPATTLGGGVILDPRWHRRRAADRQRAATALMASEKDALLLWVEEAGEGGATAAGLAQRLGTTPAALETRLDALTADGRLLVATSGASKRWISPASFKRLAARAHRVLNDYFDRQRLAVGMPKAEAVRRFVRPRGRGLADVYLEWLEAQKVVAVVDRLVTLPGRSVDLSSEESGLAGRLAERFEGAGLTPPSPAEICGALGAKPQICAGVIDYLVQQRRLVKLPNGLLLSTRALDRLAADLRALGWKRFSVPEFKDQFGLSRKWAIPLLEHLDSVGVTRRAGDERLVI